jgi:hypothetical protein
LVTDSDDSSLVAPRSWRSLSVAKQVNIESGVSRMVKKLIKGSVKPGRAESGG